MIIITMIKIIIIIIIIQVRTYLRNILQYANNKVDNFDNITNTFKTINVYSTIHSEHDGYSYHGYYWYSYVTKYFIIKKEKLENGDYLIISQWFTII